MAGNVDGNRPSGPGYLAWLTSRVLYAQREPARGNSRLLGHGTLNAHIAAGYNNGSGFPHADATGFRYGLGVAPFVSRSSLPRASPFPITRASSPAPTAMAPGSAPIAGVRTRAAPTTATRSDTTRWCAMRSPAARPSLFLATRAWSSSSRPATPGRERIRRALRALVRMSWPSGLRRTSSLNSPSQRATQSASIWAKLTPSTPGAPPFSRLSANGWARMSSRQILVVEGMKPPARLLLGCPVQRPLKPPEFRGGCQAHANPSPLGSSKRTPNQGPFPPLALPSFAGTMGPSDACRARPRETATGSPRPRDRPPVLPVTACVRAAPTTPASRAIFLRRSIRSPPAAFVQ